MPNFSAILIAPAALLVASCAAVPADGAAAGECPIAGSSDWAAWVNAMPGPNAQPSLIVTGKVTVPTGGYRPHLELEQVAQSYPVQVFARLHPNPPTQAATQALVTHDVRGRWPMSPPVGSVTIRCGGEVLARISPVETAH
jgi:hypothetical protein